MTTSNITRRTALAGAAVLPGVLPPLAMAQETEPDPAVAILDRWREARREESAGCDALEAAELAHGIGSAEAERVEETILSPATDRVSELHAEAAAIIPTTLAGLVAKLTIAVDWEDSVNGAKGGTPEDALLVSLLIAAEKLAGVSYGAHDLPSDDPEAMLRAWRQRRLKYEAAEARLEEVSQDRGAKHGLFMMRRNGEMNDDFLAASAREGWTLDYVLTGEGPKFRPEMGGTA